MSQKNLGRKQAIRQQDPTVGNGSAGQRLATLGLHGDAGLELSS
jgi:hypothetical protein